MTIKTEARYLYKKGYTYNQIAEKLGCAKSTISFHCSDLATDKNKKLKAVREKAKEEAKKNKNPRVFKRKIARYPYNGYYFYYKVGKDGRRRIHLVHSETRKVKYKLLARYRLEVKLGRFLKENETVDHIDENKLNDAISNLQVLTLRDNILKSALSRNPRLNDKRSCVICRKPLKRLARGKTCSRDCRVKYRIKVHGR